MKVLFSLLFVMVLFVSGCVTGTAVTSRYVGETEGLVVGKVLARYNGGDISNRVRIEVKDAAGRVFVILPDENGLVFARLPVGEYRFSTISHARFPSNFLYGFDPDRVTFRIPRGGAVYDLGGVQVEWRGCRRRVA